MVFELLEPRNTDAASLSGSGTFEVYVGGMLRMVELELRKPGSGDEVEEGQGGYGMEEEYAREREEERE